jgi:hypothetical protein
VHSHSSGAQKKSGNSCRYNSKKEYQKDGGSLADNPLSEFLGPDGLMRLLLSIAENELPTLEVLEMIKRLHIPGYEHARKHFKGAISSGVFDPDMPENFYRQHDIKATLDFIKHD